MADDQKNDPASHMRNMSGSSSPVSRLPKKDGGSDSFLAKLPRGSTKNEAPAPAPKPEEPPAQPSSPPEKTTSGSARKFSIGPIFWTIASVISLTVNVVVLVILLSVLSILRTAKLNVLTLGPDLLGGLYTNFEKMDRASITTNIPVDAQIPLSINVPVQTTTEIMLAQTAVISGARVRINTNTLDIDAPADVTLPAGTKLTVVLNFNLPVQDTIPIHVDVPVNIPLAQTDLHEPFVGLRDVVAPLYCLFKGDAVGMDGQLICK